MSYRPSIRCCALVLAGAVSLCAFSPREARAEALLLIEASTGKVLHAENATYPWYPASVTKMMTAYVTFRALKEQRITLDKLLTVSDNAVAQQPSKMGFRAGTQVTVDNALKMLMVKSANDMAVVLAEGVSGSIENFATEMNDNARRLGMTQTSYVNPNGLPADGQVTSARDLAILARAMIRDFPDYDLYWHIPAIRLGKRIMRNTNRLIDAYPGADGMKTGFICASGFNLVAAATRNNRRLIAVVLGAHSGAERAERAAQLLETGFTASPLTWLMPSLGSVENLQPVNVDPPNLRDEMCGPRRKRRGTPTDDDHAANPESSAAFAAVAPSLRLNGANTGSLLGPRIASIPPIQVYIGAKPSNLDNAAIPAKPRAAKHAKPRKGGKVAAAPAAEKKEPDTAQAAQPTGDAATKPKRAAVKRSGQ